MRALVIGGGVAGPVLGLFLRRAGIEPLVCEQRSAMSAEEGAFLGVAPNGMNVLAQLGLQRAIEEVGEPARGFQFQNTRGEPIGAIDGQHDLDNFGARLVMIKRGVLQTTLLEAARAAGVETRLGKRLAQLEQTPQEVVATFEDGSQERAELLIGCDGLRSRTRSLIFPDAPQPDFNGLIGLGGFVQARGDEPLEPGMNVMVFGKTAFFGAFLGRRGEIWWFHNVGQSQPDSAEAKRYGRAELLHAHRSDPAWINSLIERTAQIVGPWPQHDIMSLPRWHQQRVCLIGDAAHATSPSGGQGASLALEDALLLARTLRELPEPTQAFAKFEALRRTRVETAVRVSRRQGSGKAPNSAAAAWIRDRMMPLFLKMGASAMRDAYAYRADFA